MVEFNPDGSLKLPEHMQKKKLDDKQRFLKTACMKVTKCVVSTKSPKKCLVKIELSKKFTRNDFVEKMFRYFNYNSETPMQMSKESEREFHVEVGSNFKRCSECTSLIGRYREYNDSNMIIKKEGCTYEPNKFKSEEDFFE